jgi:hypothetical protein
MANGKWSKAENLGATINTAGDESFPFMHADNETLYFTSSGLDGYGGTDIFMTKKGMGGFGKPMNIGYPINTINNEGSMVVTADGKKAFYAATALIQKVDWIFTPLICVKQLDRLKHHGFKGKCMIKILVVGSMLLLNWLI